MKNRLDNLIPMNKRTPEERRELGRKGGLTKSYKRNIALQLDNLKRKGMNDETYKRIYDVATDPDISALDILLFLEKWKAQIQKPIEAIQMGNTLIALHRAKFGDIQKIESKNQNVNVDIVSPLKIEFKFDEKALNILKELEEHKQK